MLRAVPLFAACLTLASMGLSTPAQACSCSPNRSAAESLDEYDAVFEGVIVSVSGNRVRFRVGQSWKGPRRGGIFTAGFNRGRLRICGFEAPLRAGMRYMVFARSRSERHARHLGHVDGLCNPTRPFGDQAPWLTPEHLDSRSNEGYLSEQVSDSP